MAEYPAHNWASAGSIPAFPIPGKNWKSKVWTICDRTHSAIAFFTHQEDSLLEHSTFLPFENILINLNQLTHVVKGGNTIFLYFVGQSSAVTFNGDSANQLWEILISHQKQPSTFSVKF